MAGPTHNLFLDDSGDKGYRDNGKYSRHGGPTPLFVFAGLCASPLGAAEINYRMRTLKRETFGTPDVEIKANWLKRPHERARRYLHRYGITDDGLTAFTDELYRIINETDCRLLACVVNKKEMRDQYDRRAYHPPAVAYECVLQRAQKEMMACNDRIGVTIDHMTGAIRVGNQHRFNLQRQHARLKKFGSSLIRGASFDRVENLSFKDSAHDERLQLADLIAYAVYRQFVDHGPDWGDPSKPLNVYDYLGRVLNKFWCDDRKVVAGYGLVKFSTKQGVKWGLNDG